MFADLDESIRRLLVERGHLNSGEVDIAFEMPTREWAAGISRPTVNLYLYDIRENMQLRAGAPWDVRRGPNNTAIKSRPDVQVDLSYSITAFASAIEDEHRLLSRVLVTLLQHPVLPGDILQGAVSGQELRTFTAQPSAIIQSPADYWGALDNDIRPSLDYRLTLRVPLDQDMSVGLALTSQFRLGQINGRNGKTEPEAQPLKFGGRIHRGGDAEAGIPGVKVTLLERALDTVTDAEGRYSFSGVLPGRYTLVIAAPEMDERREQVDVPGSSYDVGL